MSSLVTHRDHLSAIYHEHAPLIRVGLLFLALRGMAILLLLPGGWIEGGRPDIALYREIGALAAAGRYPYLHYWMEYPPIIPWLAVLAYRLTLRIPPWFDDRLWYNTLVHGAMLPFEMGSLALVYLIVRRLYGPEKGLHAAGLFAAMFGPLFAFLSLSLIHI